MIASIHPISVRVSRITPPAVPATPREQVLSLQVKKAVIPAAGLGTRFLPATKAVPKELLPIVDKPSIQYIVEEAAAAGISHAIFVLSSGKDAILDHFDYLFEIEETLRQRGDLDLLRRVERLHDLVSIVSVRQKKPLGLGHAILTAKGMIGDEPFAVLLGDDLVDAEVPCIKQMMDVYARTQMAIVAVLRVPHAEVFRYGIVKGTPAGPRMYRVEEMVEKPPVDEAPSDLAIIGRYILPPDIFPLLEKTQPGRGGEIQITDALSALAKERGVIAYEFEGDRYDAGDKLGFLQANVVFGLRQPEIGPRLETFLRELLSRR